MSDTPAATVGDIATDLARFVGIVRQTTTIGQLLPRTATRITVFADPREHALFRSDPNFAGEYTRTRDANLMQLAFDDTLARNRSVLFHEFVHHLLRNQPDAVYPLWYEEGLAELLASVRWRGDAIAIGLPLRSRLAAFESGDWIPIGRLLSARTSAGREAERGNLLYAQSWALVHYFHATRGRRFEQMLDYLEWLRRGHPWRDAFRRSFDIRPAELDAELRAHVASLRRRPRFLNLPMNAAAPPPDWEIAALPPARVAADLTDLLLIHGRERVVLALALTERGLEASPDDPRLGALHAWCLALAGENDAAERRLATVVTREPEHAFVQLVRGRLAMARVRGSDPVDRRVVAEARDAFRRSAALDPDGIEAIAQLGLTYAEPAWGGDPAEGLLLLERAYARSPWSIDIGLGLGLVYARVGDTVRATPLLRAVARFAQDAELSERARQALVEYGIGEPRRD